MLTTIATFEGNLAADPQLRFTPNGKQVTELTVLVNDRRRNDAGEWADAEPTRHTVKVFGQMAENVAESLAKGDRAVVVGNVITETWPDKQTGEKRTKPVVLAESIAPSLRWATAALRRVQRGNGGSDQPLENNES